MSPGFVTSSDSLAAIDRQLKTIIGGISDMDIAGVAMRIRDRSVGRLSDAADHLTVEPRSHLGQRIEVLSNLELTPQVVDRRLGQRLNQKML